MPEQARIRLGTSVDLEFRHAEMADAVLSLWCGGDIDLNLQHHGHSRWPQFPTLGLRRDRSGSDLLRVRRWRQHGEQQDRPGAFGLFDDGTRA